MNFKNKIYFLILLYFFCSEVKAQSWEYSGLKGSYISAITADAEGILYAAGWGSSSDTLFFSDDEGLSWKVKSTSLFDTTFVVPSSIAFSSTGSLFLSCWGDSGGIYKSTDKGLSWNYWSEEPVDLWKVAVNPVDNRLFAGSFQDIYSSNDDGESWSKVYSTPDFIDVEDFIITNDSVIFAVGYFHILRSYDNGVTWDTLDTGTESTYFTKITLSANNILFVGSDWGGIYSSTDMGDTWIYKEGLPAFLGIASNSDGAVLGGGEFGGIYLTTDNGATWNSMNSGLPILYIRTIYVDKNNYAYCYLHSYGIYKSTSPVTDIESDNTSLITSFKLAQNYPNPFNPSTTISYQVPYTSYVSLKVYDMLGNEIVILVNKEQSAGEYDIDFNAPGLSSGVYFYKLTSGNFSIIKKAVLLK